MDLKHLKEKRMAPHGKSCSADANHHHDSPEMGIQYSLYTKINKNNLECLNESVEGTGKNVFKPWEERLYPEKVRLYIHLYLHFFNFSQVFLNSVKTSKY